MLKTTKQTIALLVLSATTLGFGGAFAYEKMDVGVEAEPKQALMEREVLSKEAKKLEGSEADGDYTIYRDSEFAALNTNYKVLDDAPSLEDLNTALELYQQRLTDLANDFNAYEQLVERNESGVYPTYFHWRDGEFDSQSFPIVVLSQNLKQIAGYLYEKGEEVPVEIELALDACYNIMMMPSKFEIEPTMISLRNEMEPLLKVNQSLSDHGYGRR